MSHTDTDLLPQSNKKGPCKPARTASRLAISVEVERSYDPDREAMVAALRLVLGLPTLTKNWSEGRGE